ncbi:MAG: hypothetical protein ACK59G_08130 [Cyanobacteriota bacterium]
MSSAISPAGSPSGRQTARTRMSSGGLARTLALASLTLLVGLAATGCQRGPSAESQRLDRVDLKLQQLEQRLNKLSVRAEDGADKAGKPPAGVIKSLTLRMGSEDDRLRIYWADGSKTDLPCTKEQSTFVCG